MSRFEAFWTLVCDYRQHLWIGVMMMLFLFILNAIPLLVVTPGTASHAIAIVNLVMIVSAGAVLGWMYWVCLQRRRQYY